MNFWNSPQEQSRSLYDRLETSSPFTIKVLAIIFSTFFVVQAIIFYADISREERNLLTSLEAHADSYLSIMHPKLSQFLQSRPRPKSLELPAATEINALFIFDTQDQLAFWHGPQAHPAQLQLLTQKSPIPILTSYDDRRYMELYRQLRTPEGRYLGGVIMRLSVDEIFQRTRNERYLNIVLALALFIVGGLGIVATTSHYGYRSMQLAFDNARSYNNDILQSLNVGVITVDLIGKIITVNDNAAKILYLGSNIVGQQALDIFADQPALFEIITDGVENHTTYQEVNLEYWHRPQVFDLLVSSSQLKNSTKVTVGMIFIFNDTTKLRQLERKFIRHDRMAALGRMTAEIAHEIKNPLTAIDINMQLLSESVSELNTEHAQGLQHYIKVINIESDRLNRTIETFVTFAKHTPISLEPISPAAIIEQVLSLLTPQISSTGIHLETDIALDHNYHIRGDANKIKQLLLNLIINAIAALSRGGQLQITAYNKEHCFGFTVADNGVGIASADQTKVFDLFFTTKYSGSGIGLPICQKIVDEHNGSIEFTSAIGQGTRFTVSLPETPHHG